MPANNLHLKTMCGRYTFTSVSHLKDRYRLAGKTVEFTPNYNIAPGSLTPVIVRQSPNHAVLKKWGLIPFWAKDPRIGYKLINARSETVATKPSFKHAFKHNRCLVPANGFYEWQADRNGKQPYYIKLTSDRIMSFAGIHDTWQDAEGKTILTYTILTTQANFLIQPVHSRMPVILKKRHEDIWLNPQSTSAKLLPLLTPYPANLLTIYPVSQYVNKPQNNSKEAIKPLDS